MNRTKYRLMQEILFKYKAPRPLLWQNVRCSYNSFVEPDNQVFLFLVLSVQDNPFGKGPHNRDLMKSN
jgi:hypothetical protein